MLDNYSGEQGDTAQREKCKPDYEGMIATAREKLAREERFRDSVLLYTRGTKIRGPLAELLGELVSNCVYFQAKIDAIIKQQEENA